MTNIKKAVDQVVKPYQNANREAIANWLAQAQEEPDTDIIIKVEWHPKGRASRTISETYISVSNILKQGEQS